MQNICIQALPAAEARRPPLQPAGRRRYSYCL